MRATTLRLALPLLLLTGAATTRAAEKFPFSFQTPVAKEPRLKMFNPSAATPSSTTDAGLSLTVLERPFAVTFGVQSKLTLKGDFEVTLAYEDLTTEGDLPQYGSGVSVTLHLDRETPVGYAMVRTRRPEGDRFGATEIRTGKDGRPVHLPELKPAIHRGGQVRLERKGDRIRFLAVDGLGGDFQQLRELPVGPENVTSIQFQCYRTAGGGPVSVRLKELTIVADQFITPAGLAKKGSANAPDGGAEEASGGGAGGGNAPAPDPSDAAGNPVPLPAKSPDRTLLWVVIIGLVVIVIIVAVLLRGEN
jgi:hypothetical protein